MKKLPLIPTLIPTLILAVTATVLAADAPPKSEADILKSVKLPDGYEATVFAMPPTVGYPTAVSASADVAMPAAILPGRSSTRSRRFL